MPVFSWDGSKWVQATSVKKWESSNKTWNDITGVHYWDGTKWIRTDTRKATTKFTTTAMKAENSTYQGGTYNNDDMRTGTYSGGNYQGWAFGSISKLGTVKRVTKCTVNLTKGTSGGTNIDTITLYRSTHTNTTTPPSTAGSTLSGAGANIKIGVTSGWTSTAYTYGVDSNQSRVCDIVKEVMNSGGSFSIWNGTNTSKYSNYTTFSIDIEYEY